ncbi:MAG: hypothetical protein LBE76_06845, partial [Nitrososphaerota archaeon]|nr:hypothetical protein [Nitrososphaerota archaeon]
GTIVQQGAIYITATATNENSTYEKIVTLVKEAQEKKAPIERTANKYARYFTPFILLIGLIVFVITQDILRMAAVFIIACPCALILVTPTAIVTNIGNGVKNGILALQRSNICYPAFKKRSFLLQCDPYATVFRRNLYKTTPTLTNQTKTTHNTPTNKYTAIDKVKKTPFF